MKIKNQQISLLLLIAFLLTGCHENKNCFEKYPIKAFPTINLAINIDSSYVSNNCCIYLADIFITLPSGSWSEKGQLYLENDKIYMKLTIPESETFLLFDLSLNEFGTQKIEIKQKNAKDVFDCVYEKKIFAQDSLEVRIFRFKNFQHSVFPDGHEFNHDVIFFVTKKYGIVGSYFTDPYYPEKIMFSPGGDIFKGYIDYSDITLKKLL